MGVIGKASHAIWQSPTVPPTSEMMRLQVKPFLFGGIMFTHQYLLNIINFNHETGIFTRIVKTSNSVQVGNIAGTINKKGYLVFRIKGKLYRANRVAWFYMTGEWPKLEVDHKNTIRTDNRLCNLRLATRQENQRNSNITKRNSSGYKGVSLTKNKQKWRAYATINKKQINLGVFDTSLEASIAYKAFV